VGPDLANDGNFRSAWSPDEGDHQPWLEIDLETERRISVVSLIQQVPKDAAPAAIGTITFEFWKASAWTRMATVQDPNPTCIQAIPATVARRVRVRIDRAAGTPSVADIGLYDEP
jgi:alpha-L-fucosidase